MKAKDVATLKSEGRQFTYVWIEFGTQNVISGEIIDCYKVGSSSVVDSIYCLKYLDDEKRVAHFYLDAQAEIILTT